MARSFSNGNSEYIVYIFSGKGKRTLAGISGQETFSLNMQNEKFSKLVYFEKFKDKTKALRRIRQIKKLDDAQRIFFVKKKNPELLNLIFTVNDF